MRNPIKAFVCRLLDHLWIDNTKEAKSRLFGQYVERSRKCSRCGLIETDWHAIVHDAPLVNEKPPGAKGKCLHLHGSYLEGGAKFCNDCAEEIGG